MSYYKSVHAVYSCQNASALPLNCSFNGIWVMVTKAMAIVPTCKHYSDLFNTLSYKILQLSKQQLVSDIQLIKFSIFSFKIVHLYT